MLGETMALPRKAAMMMRPALALVSGVAALAGAAQAAPQSHDPANGPPPAEPCFAAQDVVRYHGHGDRMLILRTRTDRYYAVGFVGACPNVLRPDASIVVQAQGGSDQVCRPIDLKVTVTAGGFPLTCAIASITPLAPEEVAALPDKDRP
jgi:hypothetical protein